MNFEMIRNASVAVTPRTTSKGLVAVASINDKHEHVFDTTSRVSKALAVMAPQDLSARMSGGHYFFIEDDLIDFRPGMYNGFIQTDDSIGQLIDHIGVMNYDDVRKALRTIKGNTISSRHVLGAVWSDHGIKVPGYHEGGDFKSQLLFMWNPFTKNVNTFFQLTRLICENGMVGLATFLNRKIPLINRWEEHLDMANRQIQNKVEAVASRRLVQMGTERATLDELSQLHNHARARHEHSLKRVGARQLATERLVRIMDVLDPMKHLSGVYRSNVFGDRRLSAQVPGHLTTFDAYNVATELRTHSEGSDKSTDLALDRFSNRILFDRKDLIGVSACASAPALSSFSDPDAAFFGLMH
jgi:hypothetical protein